MDATVTIGVPFDSVGRGGGTEETPAVLRELGYNPDKDPDLGCGRRLVAARRPRAPYAPRP